MPKADELVNDFIKDSKTLHASKWVYFHTSQKYAPMKYYELQTEKHMALPLCSWAIDIYVHAQYRGKGKSITLPGRIS